MLAGLVLGLIQVAADLSAWPLFALTALTIVGVGYAFVQRPIHRLEARKRASRAHA
jgi:hypothetical protein